MKMTEKTVKLIQTAAFGVPEHEMKWDGTYRPPISSAHLRQLWSLKEHTGRPITQLVSDALDHYFQRIGKGVTT